jgi:hypothetical protein
MQVICCGLTLTQMPPAHLKLYFCTQAADVENLLLLMEPAYLIIAEQQAEAVLSQVKNNGTEVIVVGEQVRYWTAHGASMVWDVKEWESTLQGLGKRSIQHEDQYSGHGKEHTTSNEDSSSPETMIIAVGSTNSGVGSTHTALLIGQYLAKYGKGNVAIWEAGANPCFEFLEYVQQGSYNGASYFDYGNVTLFKSGKNWNWMDIAMDRYAYVVLDLGDMQDQPEQVRLFLKSHLPVLVSSGSTWRMKDLIQFCREHTEARQERWRITLPLASKESRDEVAEILSGRPIFALPCHSEPLQASSETEQVLEGILSPILPKKTKKWLSHFF